MLQLTECHYIRSAGFYTEISKQVSRDKEEKNKTSYKGIRVSAAGIGVHLGGGDTSVTDETLRGQASSPAVQRPTSYTGALLPADADPGRQQGRLRGLDCCHTQETPDCVCGSLPWASHIPGTEGIWGRTSGGEHLALCLVKKLTERSASVDEILVMCRSPISKVLARTPASPEGLCEAMGSWPTLALPPHERNMDPQRLLSWSLQPGERRRRFHASSLSCTTKSQALGTAADSSQSSAAGSSRSKVTTTGR